MALEIFIHRTLNKDLSSHYSELLSPCGCIARNPRISVRRVGSESSRSELYYILSAFRKWRETGARTEKEKPTRKASSTCGILDLQIVVNRSNWQSPLIFFVLRHSCVKSGWIDEADRYLRSRFIAVVSETTGIGIAELMSVWAPPSEPVHYWNRTTNGNEDRENQYSQPWIRHFSYSHLKLFLFVLNSFFLYSKVQHRKTCN